MGQANKNILDGSNIELGYATESLDYGNEFGAAESVCRLLDVNQIEISNDFCFAKYNNSQQCLQINFRVKTLQLSDRNHHQHHRMLQAFVMQRKFHTLILTWILKQKRRLLISIQVMKFCHSF